MIAAPDLVSLVRAQLILGEGRHRILARVALGELEARPIDGRVFLVRSQVEQLAAQKHGASERIAAPA